MFIVCFHIFAKTERGYLAAKHIQKQDMFFSFNFLFEVKFEKLILLYPFSNQQYT